MKSFFTVKPVGLSMKPTEGKSLSGVSGFAAVTDQAGHTYRVPLNVTKTNGGVQGWVTSYPLFIMDLPFVSYAEATFTYVYLDGTVSSQKMEIPWDYIYWSPDIATLAEIR